MRHVRAHFPHFPKACDNGQNWPELFAHEPDLLVLDEPFDGLDPVARHDLVNLVRTWAQTRSLLVASHLLHEVEALRADLAVILGGRLVANGSAQEIRDLVDALPTKIKFKTPSVNNLARIACAAGAVETLYIPDENTVVIGDKAGESPVRHDCESSS